MKSSRLSAESDDDLDDEKPVAVGHIVWEEHGSIWYPAKVCSTDDVPEHILKKLGRKLGGKYIVKWRDEESY